MKYILFLFFTPALLKAQDSTSTSFEVRNGTFFIIEKTYLSGGRILTDERPADTDTAAAITQVITPVLKAATQYANIAATAARINKPRQQINEASAVLQSLIGQDYYTITNRVLIGEFLPTDTTGQLTDVAYTMRVDDTPVPVTLRRNASGQLIMRQGATSFRVDIVSRNWLRIRRYQGTETLASDGTFIDLFQEKNGNYISSDLKYRLRR